MPLWRILRHESICPMLCCCLQLQREKMTAGECRLGPLPYSTVACYSKQPSLNRTGCTECRPCNEACSPRLCLGQFSLEPKLGRRLLALWIAPVPEHLHRAEAVRMR